MRKGIFILVTSNIISKPIGLLRQMLFAIFYGVTATMSALRFSQTITIVFMNFFTTDTLNAGFLPLFERYKKESPELAQCFFWYLVILIASLSTFIFALLFFGAENIVYYFAPGFKGTVVNESVLFIKILAFSVPFCLLGTLFSYRAMSIGSYFGVSSRAIFESVGLMIGIGLSYWQSNVAYIAWAFVFTYFIFFIIVTAICYRKDQLQLVKIGILLHNIKKLGTDFWRTIRFLLILPIFMQGKFVVEKFVASLIAVSTVASLDYARSIVEMGINVLAIPIGLLGLSAFSIMDKDTLSQNLTTIVTILLNITIPITLFLIFNAKLVVTVLYGYGAFDASAIAQASEILSAMSLTFFASVIAYVLMTVLSSQLQNHRVVNYLVIALLSNIVFNLLFYKLLGPACLGYGESIYAFVAFLLCVRHFKLFPLLQKNALFLLPASCIYAASSFYMIEHYPLSPHYAFIQQTIWFCLFWGSVLMLPKTNRELMLGRGWVK